jgi:hypothetical protein
MASNPTGHINAFAPPTGTPEHAGAALTVTANASIAVPKEAREDYAFSLIASFGGLGTVTLKTLHPGQSDTMASSVSFVVPGDARSCNVIATLTYSPASHFEPHGLADSVANYPITH